MVNGTCLLLSSRASSYPWCYRLFDHGQLWKKSIHLEEVHHLRSIEWIERVNNTVYDVNHIVTVISSVPKMLIKINKKTIRYVGGKTDVSWCQATVFVWNYYYIQKRTHLLESMYSWWVSPERQRQLQQVDLKIRQKLSSFLDDQVVIWPDRL